MRYRAPVEYDGTDFAGFQVNPGKRTVQGILEDALRRLGDEEDRTGRRGRTDGCRGTRRGAGHRLLLRRTPHGGGAGQGARCAAPRRHRHQGSAPDEHRLQPPLCGAVSGVPLHRLERAAQPASRAHGARGAGPTRHRRDGAGRVGLHRPTRLRDLRGDGPLAGPDRHGGPGPEEGPARDDRRPRRRLPPRDGPADGGRPPGGGPRKDGYEAGPVGTRRSRSGPRRGSRPGQGALPPARRPRATTDRTNGEHEER